MKLKVLYMCCIFELGFLTHFGFNYCDNVLEVGLEQNYNEKCDVYSFAIMLWQMYSLKTPFELYTMKSLKSRVWGGEKKRPFVQDSWPVPIKNLLRRSWSSEINDRPSFAAITKILRNECVRVREGNEDGLEHERRRSTFVFRGERGKLTSTRTSAPSKLAEQRMRKSLALLEATEEEDYSESAPAVAA
mmetsp:Transcript_4261/g.7833  ORF Transcript_4261/g.7833 Transcript_4261/m.7833 type:complete len:189 (+) Transcript_4261:1366-1932(+)